MASKDSLLPRLVQAVDRGHLVATVIKLYGYKVVQQSLVERTFNPESKSLLTIDGEVFRICSPVFKIEDEDRVWKLKFEEYNEDKVPSEVENDSVFLGDIRFKTRKVDVTGDPNGSQLRQLCQKGIMEDIQCALKYKNSCNLLLNLCDVPYPRPEDLCDKTFSNSLLKLEEVNKVLIVHPKIEAENCGLEAGLEGTWSRYLATDMVCLLWKKDECHFTKFEKKYLKHVVQNGLHDVKVKEQQSFVEKELESTKIEENSVKREENSMKKDENLTKKEENLAKEESPKKEEKVVKKDEKLVKKEEKSIKKDEKSVLKKDEKSIKREPKTLRSEQRPVKKEPKPVKNEQKSMSLKRESKLLKNDQKLAKNEPSPRSVKREQKTMKNEPKTTKNEQKSMKNDQKPTKNGQKPGKKEPKSLTKEQEPNKEEQVLANGQKPKTLADLAAHGKLSSPLLVEICSHPVVRGFFLTLVLLAFYFLSSEILVTLLLIATSIWFKYGSKKPEFKKYTRSGDQRVLAFRRIYEKEIEKLRYAKDLRRMREIHKELKESVLNAYAVNRVSKGDIIGVEDHEELERELELTFKEFVTENDVETLLHEAHYTSFILALTVFLYLTSRVVYLALGKLWRPVRTVAIIVAGILLCVALCIVSNFLSTSIISRRLVGSAEMFCVVFGLWLVTDVTGFLIEIRACIDHVTGVIWRECDLEKCIIKTPSYLVVKLALDCSVLLSLFPLVYVSSWLLSIFSVSSVTMVSVARYFPPGVILLRLCTRLAFFGEVLRLANVIMFTSLASKFYGLHKKKEDPLDALLYNRLGYDMGSFTEYVWKAIVKHINDLN